MSTLQNTISMMKTLPEADLIKIQDFAKKLSERHELEAADEAVGRFLKPMSPEDFMKDIETAEKAARSVRDDILETKIRLSHIADSLKLCESPHLRDLGYRIIHLKRHNYFMLYKIIHDHT